MSEKKINSKQRRAQVHYKRLERRKKVAGLYLRRYTMAEIAEVIDCSLSTVVLDIKHIKKEWQEEAREKIGEVISRELAEIQHLENQAAREFIRQRETKFLELRLKCKDRRAKLLGLDQPEKHLGEVKISGGMDIDLGNLTDSELDILQKIMERHEDDGK